MTHAGASPSWERMWKGGLGQGQAFDVGDVSATLSAALARESFAPRPGMTALVPGCGRAYDALALAKHGFESVVAVDLAPTACKAAQTWLRETGDPAAAKVSVQCADFFSLQGEHDFIWDCTFLCALDPSVRQSWARKQSELLSKDGTLLTCVFPICEKVGGPPFAMSVPLVRELLEPVGLQAVAVQDPVPEAERHNPGGAPGALGTALLAWRKSENCSL
mmetsp:Transcript_148381/g.269582  ORF Transcript_148381/g.269582 Transcript_148381/m.269582 type:complete len:220 (+) Transcript_148381:1-660(+)